MTFEPLANAPLAVQLHVATVVPAALIGLYILLTRKGTPFHRMLGKIWVVLMVSTSVFSLFIHEINLFYGFSPIHLFSIGTPIGCLLAVRAARNRNIRLHKYLMVSTYVGGIVVAGGFTFAPGRIMNRMVFAEDGSMFTGILSNWQLSLVAGAVIFAVTALMIWRNRVA